MANIGYALSQGLAAGAKSGSGLLSQSIQEDADMRAANRRLADQERLLAIQESMQARAAERNERIRQQGRAADFTFDTNPNNVQARGEAESSMLRVTGQARNEVEREEEIRRGNDPKYLGAKRNMAAAGQAPERAGVAEGRGLENEIKRMQLDDLKKDRDLVEEYRKPDTSPERKKQIIEERQALAAKAGKAASPTALMQNVGFLKSLGYSDEKVEKFIFDGKGISTEELASKILAADKFGDLSPEDAARKAVELRNAVSNAQGGGQKAASGGAPYPDGTRLKGRDGKAYVVKNGQPILESEAGRTSGGLIKQAK